LTAVNGGAVYSGAAGLAVTAAGTSKQVLTSNGAGAPTWENQGWEYLGTATCASNCATTGAVTVTAKKQLMIMVTITGYTGGGDIAALRFNADAGNNYWSRHMNAAAGGTTWTNNQTLSTSLIRLAPTNSTRARTVTAYCSNVSTVTSKTCTMSVQTATGSAATGGVLDFGAGEWISAASTQVTSIEMRTAGGGNMTAGTGFVVYGKDF
jgi:hypothetical protein